MCIRDRGNGVLFEDEGHRRKRGPVRGTWKQEARKNEDRTGNDEESHPPNGFVQLQEAVKGDLRLENEDDRLRNGAALEEEKKIEDVRIRRSLENEEITTGHDAPRSNEDL